MRFQYVVNGAKEMMELGKKIGYQLRGGEVIELIGDLGTGKTTLVKGLAKGFGSDSEASSPSFTISNTYQRSDGKTLNHFDFYRLDEAGIVGQELGEIAGQKNDIVVVEWAKAAEAALPSKRLIITLTTESEDGRLLDFEAPSEVAYLVEMIDHE